MAGALISGIAGRTFLSLTAAFVVAGFVLGEGGFEVLDFDPTSQFVQGLAVVALIVILFRDGLEVEEEMLQEAWHLPLRKLVLAMPLTCVLVALVTHALTDLDWTESFLVGALLSPTDPVLSSAVITNPRVPRLDPPLAQPRVWAERRPGAPGGAGVHGRRGRRRGLRLVGVRASGRAGGGRCQGSRSRSWRRA